MNYKKRQRGPRKNRPRSGKKPPSRKSEASKSGSGNPRTEDEVTKAIKKDLAPLKRRSETPPKHYGILQFESFKEAKEKLDQIKERQSQVDLLNIVIKQEGDMNDPELTNYGRVYAGAAWSDIHQRRLDEGWYEKPN